MLTLTLSYPRSIILYPFLNRTTHIPTRSLVIAVVLYRTMRSFEKRAVDTLADLNQQVNDREF